MKRPITEEQCLAIGGHCWNEYWNNEPVDEFGERSNPTMVFAIAPTSKGRICKHCGKKEGYRPGEWK